MGYKKEYNTRNVTYSGVLGIIADTTARTLLNLHSLGVSGHYQDLKRFHTSTQQMLNSTCHNPGQ
jgi:hypothetical protein